MLEPRFIEFTKPQSFAACASQCVVLSAECEEVAGALGYADEDARSVALRNASHVAGAAAMILNVLDAGTRSPEQALRALLGVTAGQIQVAADDLDKFARLGLVTLVQFQIENLLANLVRAGGSSPPRNYSLLVESTLASYYEHSLDRARISLLVPAWIRNTLHNNGIYGGPSQRVQVHGCRYAFRGGRRFSQAGWAEVVHALRAELRTIERLLYSTAVQRLPSPIQDRYVTEAAGG